MSNSNLGAANLHIIQQNYNFFYPSENTAIQAMRQFENLNQTSQNFFENTSSDKKFNNFEVNPQKQMMNTQQFHPISHPFFNNCQQSDNLNSRYHNGSMNETMSQKYEAYNQFLMEQFI